MGIFDFLRGKPRHSGPSKGGSGSSMEDAIVIKAPTDGMGIAEEYTYLQQHYGQKDRDWKVEGQALLMGQGGKPYDLLTVKFKDGKVREFYFDISSFFGKF